MSGQHLVPSPEWVRRLQTALNAARMSSLKTVPVYLDDLEKLMFMALEPDLLEACNRAMQLLKAAGANIDKDEPILTAISKAEGRA